MGWSLVQTKSGTISIPIYTTQLDINKTRLPREVWRVRRRIVWVRDDGACQHCGQVVSLKDCHIDHIVSGIRGTNHMRYLRTLCRRCHVLRADPRHRGMIANALRDGIIPVNWRELV